MAGSQPYFAFPRPATGRWSRLWQPKHLRFEQKHRIQVEKAPDPSDVVWENLETSGACAWYTSLHPPVACQCQILSTLPVLPVSFIFSHLDL